MREVVLLLAITGLSLAVEKKNYQLCGASNNGVYLKFPQHKNCMQPPRDEHVVVKVRLFTPTMTSEATAYACMLVNTTYYNLNSVFGGGTATRHAYSIEPEECHDWIRNLTARGEPLVEEREDVWVTEADTSHHFQLFGGFYNATNYILMRGSISSMDGRTIFSNLADFGPCMDTANREKYCKLKDRTIVFDNLPYNSRDTCIHKPLGVYEAMLSEDYVLINDFQMALTFAEAPNQDYAENCFGPGTIIMDNGFLLQYVKESKPRRFKRAYYPTYWNTPNETNYSPLVYEVNNRANFLYYKFRRYLMERFDEIWVSICDLYNQHVDLVEMFMRVDPTMAMRLWLGRDDFVAAVHGDVVMITGCRPVEAEKLFLNHTINDVCYLYLPVLTTTGKIMFALPGSRDLVLQSPTVDCKDRIVPVYNLEGKEKFLFDGAEEAPADAFHADVRETHIDLKASSVFISDLSTNSIDNLMVNEKKLKRMEAVAAKDKNGKKKINFGVFFKAENETEPLQEESPVVKEIFTSERETMQSKWEQNKKIVFGLMLAIIMVVVLTAITVCGVRMYRDRYKNYIRQINNHIKSGHSVNLDTTQLHKAAKAISASTISKAEADERIRKAQVNKLESKIGEDPVISVYLNKFKADALVDTGANTSSCTLEMAVLSDAYIEYDTVPPAVAVNGTLVPFIGQCYLNLQIGNVKRSVVLLICDWQFDDVIIGTNILEEFGVFSFDFSNKKLMIGDSNVSFVATKYYYDGCYVQSSSQ